VLQPHTHDVRAMSGRVPTADVSLHRSELPLRATRRHAIGRLAQSATHVFILRLFVFLRRVARSKTLATYSSQMTGFERRIPNNP